jgi:hypothetical protein
LLLDLAELVAAHTPQPQASLNTSGTILLSSLTLLLVASVWRVLAGAGRPR